MNYFLGVDWGEKKYGLALADGETRLAFAWKIVPAGEFWEALEVAKKEFSCREAVLGISPNYAFSQENKKKILNLEKKMQQKGWRVFLAEEFFSSILAKNNLREKAGGKKKNPEADDAEAARLILQDWLDKNIQ